MAFWKRNEPIQIGSSFYTLDIATGRIDRDKGPIRLNAVFERNSFLRELSSELRSGFREVAHGSREYRRQTELRGPNGGTAVHIVLRGCVAERTRIGSSSTVRIFGAGSVLGCMEVFDERIPAPTAICLNDTWTLSMPLDRMRALAETNTSLMKAIGISVTDRIEATERIYNRHSLKPEQRLAGLLAHLVMHCAVPGKTYDFMVEGPAQTDLADALALSIGSVEAAMATLRKSKSVITGYRTYEFPSLRRLLDTSEIQFPPESLAGALATF
ncbi:Crp/Fnr family transcriptional regulator [Streptomyces lunaelactis]|uniref:Crp/Fnr family transcriptional regulator n=1 Tax=Streptomyces lunaelactis TaxID=1535768 RepID=A0A2R4T4H9_9ACTN|nr:Crp/Fnr family transcriptional regulator [Streptomyces lunaelactis]AVZ74022.1 Crp/Fnr family transcriptional regulator [Streptomyces lunaelactis]NUK85172.1 Crp/Fnr family transcriptional regulator [Streptomyces lunaelactis]